jgi:hypothetical protein
VALLKQAETGTPVSDVLRQLGIAEQTFYRRKQRHEGLESDQVREFKQLQDENTKLKRLVWTCCWTKSWSRMRGAGGRNAGSILVRRRAALLKNLPMQ